jgi:hypothetical protein
MQRFQGIPAKARLDDAEAQCKAGVPPAASMNCLGNNYCARNVRLAQEDRIGNGR